MENFKYEEAFKDFLSKSFIPGFFSFNNFDFFFIYLLDAIIVISMLYNDFDKQEILLTACIRQKVALFISWDSGMEL